MIVHIKDGKIVTDVTVIVPDGEYFMLFRPMVLDAITTELDYQRYYFKMLEDVAKETGNSKADLHQMIKEASHKESTKEFNTADWHIYTQHAKWFIFQNLGMIV